jgi:predicted RNase H-like nuclease/ubiquinone/menaquinone biosynthesis C-methylase UbiE
VATRPSPAERIGGAWVDDQRVLWRGCPSRCRGVREYRRKDCPRPNGEDKVRRPACNHECGASMNQSKVAYFDTMASALWAAQPFGPQDQPKLDRLLAAAEIRPAMRILEPGCGTGRLTAILADSVGHCGRVFAFDLSVAMIRACRERIGQRPNVVVVQAALEDYPVAPDSFDIAICHQVFPHFDDPATACAVLARTLKPGGRLLVVHFAHTAAVNEIHRTAAGPIEHDRLPSPAEMRRLLTDAGFTVDLCVDDDRGYCVRGIRPRVVVAGIDGCRGGWLCLSLDIESRQVKACILSRIEDLLGLEPLPMVVAIDIPIGLPAAGPRRCDQEARIKLRKPRSNSVFPAPVRCALPATTYEEACRLSFNAHRRKLSRQSWGILKKIREVDAFVRADPAHQAWIREAHPEVTFWAWNANVAMGHRKKSRAGLAEREALVVTRYGERYVAAQANLPRGQYGFDDLLDAFALLWTAERIHAKKAVTLPSAPPVDGKGLRMEIVV